MKAVDNKNKFGIFTVANICSSFGLKRDAYYKYIKRYKKSKQTSKEVVSLVKEHRKYLPREGCRKLYKKLKPVFNQHNLKVGRDSLFTILRNNDMLVKRKKYSSKTTNSYHHFHKYKNIIKDIKPTRINQIWVSDITYIRTINGFCYLALVTDIFSRKIIGFDASNSLELSGCLRALQKAFRVLRYSESSKSLIHHSDRGSQYCSHQYVGELKRKGIQISMTEENHCYENAIAERVNGILKDEFYLDQVFTSLEHVKYAVKNAIKMYNSKRLHLSLDYKTPNMVYDFVA